MVLSELLKGVPVVKLFQTMYGRMVVTHEVMIQSIHYDSRRVSHNSVFVAMKGLNADGHKFIFDAVQRGAAAVVLEDDNAYPDSLAMHNGVIKIVVENARKALALISANYYGHPSERLRLIGVTGTNGKTTTASIIQQLLSSETNIVGLIGTIHTFDGKETKEATHTTPESLELNKLFSEMLKNGCTTAVMEVSSHSLALDRVYGLDFDAAVFTNLTQDHLDFHSTMEHYFQAKKILFGSLKPGAFAISNSDDTYGTRILENTQAKKITYGIEANADFKAERLDLFVDAHTTFTVDGVSVSSPLIGRFNVYNVLAGYAVGYSFGVTPKQLISTIHTMKPVSGRFERIHSALGWTAIIDYAHTPDALEKVLKAIHDVLPVPHRGKIITIFGAGGDRDKTKRPLMGKVASELSDTVIITSDNPRIEKPEKIIADVMQGISTTNTVYSEVDRRKAIHYGLSLAKRGDVILIAGKGHEDYQVLGTEKQHFSDREEVETFIRSHK